MTDFVDSQLVLPCPFCGEKSDFSFVELFRVDREKYNRVGSKIKRVAISTVVQCMNCSTEGPAMYAVSNTQTDLQRALDGVPELLPEHIEMSRQEAIFAWNQRKPISDKALELVNRMIAEAVSALKE